MKNIIFDIGNVLLSFQPEKFLKQYYSQEVMEDLMTIIFCSQEWIDLDMGTILLHEAIQSMTSDYPQYKQEMTFVLENWTDMFEPIQENIDIVYQLKEKGYHLYLLSNLHKEAIVKIYQKYNFFHLFEGGVISGCERIAKPDLLIYQTLINRYHLKAEECLFIDDMLSYANACERVGMTGLYLGYNKKLKKELESINIL